MCTEPMGFGLTYINGASSYTYDGMRGTAGYNYWFPDVGGAKTIILAAASKNKNKIAIGYRLPGHF